MAGMVELLASGAGRVAMVERDGARYTMRMATSVGAAVRPTARPPLHPAPYGAVHAVFGWSGMIGPPLVTMHCTSPTSPRPHVATLGPVAPTPSGALLSLSAASWPAPLVPIMEMGAGRSGGTWVAVTGIGGDRIPVMQVAARVPQPPPPAGASGRRSRPPAPHAAEPEAPFDRFGETMFLCG